MKKLLVVCALVISTIAQANDGQNLAEKPQFFTPETKVYYIQIQKISVTLLSIVSNLNDFLSNQLQANDKQIMSLLNFEYRENNEVTVESYERIKHFGKWVKDKKSGDCLNTRNKVLVRDNVGIITLKEDNRCSVAEGLWIDPYSEKQMINAQEEIQIDHVVPMHEAYITGAYKWTFKERCLYGNYLGYKNHLLPVSADENNEKSSSRPDTYMPSNKNYHCQYLKNWLTIKSIWGLALAQDEVKAIKELVEESPCDKADFVITKKELEEQARFFETNKNLCNYP